jgi:hypothetical protein
MATAYETQTRTAQARHYCALLELKAMNPDLVVKGLDDMIMRAKSEMTEPEISWVEKQIAERYNPK